mgnify:CR=1 FL=1
MTVGSKVKQTVASLKGAQATLAMYAELSQHEADQKTFERNALKVERIVKRLEERVKQLDFEEPQYKGF